MKIAFAKIDHCWSCRSPFTLAFLCISFTSFISITFVQCAQQEGSLNKGKPYKSMVSSEPISLVTRKSSCTVKNGAKCHRKSIKNVIPQIKDNFNFSKKLSKGTAKLKSSKDTPTTAIHFYSSNSSADITSLARSVLGQRKKCKLDKYKGFKCQRLKFYLWLINRLDQTSTPLNSWIEFVRNEDLSDNVTLSGSELMPDTWGENYVFHILTKWGDPMDLFLFHKYKEFVKSRELKLKVPNLMEIKVSPRTHAVTEVGRSTPRIFWDPGFNLKLKLPFFKDELKVAISTGPSFLAGIGTGIVLLIIKGMFAPFILGMKYLMYNMFWKDGSPLDMMRMVWGGSHGPEPWESAAPPAAIEHYDPSMGHGHFDNHQGHQFGGGPPQSMATGSGYGYGYGGGDQKLQYSQLNPILQGLAVSPEGRRQHFKSLLTGPDEMGGFGVTGGGSVISESQQNEYVPSNALQAEVENYDPFYSPLLSRIDSIFTHLGYHEEGCKERAVCSIYKFPVKYAPYSNLLSAQLSKHQSELKRPITKAPRILRYFKYMKAAKDGQGQASCIDTYPNCDHDTDSVTNLPMITTFNQLSELMGAEAGSA